MSKYRRAAKIDSNQPQIVEDLRKIPGATVEVGHDDILVGYRGKTFWYELKSPDEVSKKTDLILESAIKPSQKKLRDEFTGHYKIVSSLEEILIDLGIVKPYPTEKQLAEIFFLFNDYTGRTHGEICQDIWRFIEGELKKEQEKNESNN